MLPTGNLVTLSTYVFSFLTRFASNIEALDQRPNCQWTPEVNSSGIRGLGIGRVGILQDRLSGESAQNTL